MEREPEFKQLRLPLLSFMLQDEGFLEQLRISTLAVRQQDVLPDEMIEYHRSFLRTWGLMIVSSELDKENKI